MNKKKVLLSVTATSMIAVTGAVLVINGGLNSSSAFATNGEVWHHYAAVAPTETTHGSKEFWASSTDGCATHTFTDPGVTCVEHTFSAYESFATLSCDDDRYVPSGNESLGITPMFSTKNKTVTYGLYPQKNVNDSSLVSALNALTTPESNGWYLYNNEHYAKLSATPYTDNSFKRCVRQLQKQHWKTAYIEEKQSKRAFLVNGKEYAYGNVSDQKEERYVWNIKTNLDVREHESNYCKHKCDRHKRQS